MLLGALDGVLGIADGVGVAFSRGVSFVFGIFGV